MAFYKKFTPDKKNKAGSFAARGQGGRSRRDEGEGSSKDRGSFRRDERGTFSKGYSSPNSSFGRREHSGSARPFSRGDAFGAGKPSHGSFGQRSKSFEKKESTSFRPAGASFERRDQLSERWHFPQQPRVTDRGPAEPAAVSAVSEVPENLLSGRNPIREAIKTGRDIEKLLVAEGDLSGSAREIVSLAKNAGIIVQTVERSRLDQITRNHQGMIAFASAFAYASVEDILDTAREKGEAPFIIVLDKITDPMNLGAIIRSAACVGAHGVIVQQHRAVGLTPSAVRASAGAVEHVKVARVTNINQTIRQLKDLGIWVYAADAEGTDYRKVDFKGACALVIGSEGEGISRLTLDLCDQAVSIPMSGVIDSLNASVAAGILMYGVYTGRSGQ